VSVAYGPLSQIKSNMAAFTEYATENERWKKLCRTESHPTEIYLRTVENCKKMKMIHSSETVKL